MRISRVFNFLKWTTVSTATWTMLMAPVAMGQEAKRVSKQQVQTVVNQLGLNKKITLGEFYTKNKDLFPPRVQKEIEPLFMNFKNQLMPSFVVISSKGTSGEEIPTIRISQGNELLNLQWFGEQEKMLKFQNTSLTEVDVINFEDMFTRIIAGDEKYRKQIERNSAKSKKFSSNPKYPDVTKAEWKSMSPQNKASYIVNLRTLWQDARKVLKVKYTDNKKTKTSQNFFDKNKNFFALFLGQDVVAARKIVATGQTTENYFSGQSCIVAGYVARYEKISGAEVCNYKAVDQTYAGTDNSLYLQAKATCSASKQIACNPYVYGTPNGAPTCVTPSLTEVSFQKATHWDGPCDSSSRLQTSQNETEILKDKSKAQGRYEDGNLMSEEERKAIFKAEQGNDLKLTEDYLLGLLKFRGLVNKDIKSIFDSGVISDQILNQILIDKKIFDKEIAEAQNSCKVESAASKTEKRVHEKNYWQACDQLHRRFIFIQELFQSKCPGQKLNPDTLKCICDPATNLVTAPVVVSPIAPAPVVSAPTVPVSTPVALPSINPETVPGASCKAINPISNQPGAGSKNQDSSSPDTDCESMGAVASGDKCICPNGGTPKKEITDVANGQEVWSCPATTNSSKPDKKECGIVCSIFKGIKKYALPVLVAGVAAFALYKGLGMLAPKKPTLNSGADKCPDGSIPPCGQVCTVPLKKQANGTCSCDGCPPGQTADAITCNCSTGTSTALTYLCPDSTTRVENIDNCPTYSCWNGQSYQNPMNCPPQTPVAPSSSGTGN